MSIQLGKYHLAAYTRLPTPARPPTKEETAEIREGLGKLCTLLEGSPVDWFLVGGLGTEMRLGRLTRVHRDFDIEVHRESLLPLIEHMGRQGYHFF